MKEESLEKQLDKIRYHIRILSETVSFDDFPVEALVLFKNWDQDDLNRAHDIFERWEKKLDDGEKMQSFEFEKDFDDELGVSYQGLKSIISAFYRNGQWTNVCEAYVDSMGDSPPIEYRAIQRRERF